MCAYGRGRTRADSYSKKNLDNIRKQRSFARNNSKMELRLLWTRNSAHRRDNWSPQTATDWKDKIEDLFNQNSRISFDMQQPGQAFQRERYVVFTQRQQLFPYCLPIWTELSDADRQNWVQVAENCPRALQNDTGCLQKIVFSDACHVLLSRLVNKQNFGVSGIEYPQTAY